MRETAAACQHRAGLTSAHRVPDVLKSHDAVESVLERARPLLRTSSVHAESPLAACQTRTPCVMSSTFAATT